MTAAITWLATALLPILVWPALRGLYFGLRWVLGRLFGATAVVGSGTIVGSFFKKSMQVLFGSTVTSMFGIVFFFAGVKFIRYLLQIVMSILGFGAIYFLFVDKFISKVYALVIDTLLGLPPEFTLWLTYFGVFDGLRLLEATFLWLAAIKLVMWTLRPPSSLI